MQRTLRWISIGIFAALSCFMIWFGWVYASVTEMLWFHGAAVPAESHASFLPLYLALMNLIGGSSAAVGALTAYVSLVPLRRGAPWAGAALLGAFALVFVMAAVTAEELAAATGAPTSWHIMGVLLALTALAFMSDLFARRLQSRRAAADDQ